MLGFLRRNLQVKSQDTKASAYFTLVRPNLEYCSNVWSPYTDQAKDKIEMVQRRAARYATNRYRNKSSVTDMLEDLSWETLETRRAKSQVTMMYKITQDTRYKKLYLTSVIVKQLTLAISYFPTNMSIKITASKAAVKERSCYHIC